MCTIYKKCNCPLSSLRLLLKLTITILPSRVVITTPLASPTPVTPTRIISLLSQTPNEPERDRGTFWTWGTGPSLQEAWGTPPGSQKGKPAPWVHLSHPAGSESPPTRTAMENIMSAKLGNTVAAKQSYLAHQFYKGFTYIHLATLVLTLSNKNLTEAQLTTLEQKLQSEEPITWYPCVTH